MNGLVLSTLSLFFFFFLCSVTHSLLKLFFVRAINASVLAIDKVVFL
jgi:hypothetical protein